jgi:hypothetical protein
MTAFKEETKMGKDEEEIRKLEEGEMLRSPKSWPASDHISLLAFREMEANESPGKI